ncbi:hypothetical protein AX16_008664 [Volvariella volvacea WC 439]|nr:hypothetical protein AX16_008664 [Volvariella volvacea WC 439]
MAHALPVGLPIQPTPGSSTINAKSNMGKHTAWSRRALLHIKETDDFWSPNQITPPPNNFTPACTALLGQSMLPQYRSILTELPPLGIRNLQAWIETAWAEGTSIRSHIGLSHQSFKPGFDPEGASQIGQLSGTTKRIYGLHTLILESRPSSLILTLHGRKKGPKPLIDWIVKYFDHNSKPPTTVNEALWRSSTVKITEHMPLILQRKGHSVTVIGYEIEKDGSTNLLVFDTSFLPPIALRRTAIALFQSDRPPVPATTPGTSERTQSNSGEPHGEPEDEVVFLGHRSASSMPVDRLGHRLSNLLASDATKYFKLKPSKLSNFNKYQILYFPMSKPLDYSQRMQRKVVTSVQAC